MTIVIGLGHILGRVLTHSVLMVVNQSRCCSQRGKDKDKTCSREDRKERLETEDVSDWWSLGCPASLWDAATCFYVVLCITDLLLQTHPLSRGHAHHLPTFLTSSPDGFSPMCFLEANPVKSPPQTTPSTHTHSHHINLHIRFHITRVDGNEWVKSFDTKHSCVKNIISSSVVCFCGTSVLFIIRQNALQDTRKGKARVLRGEHCSSVSHLSPPQWGWRKHAVNAEWYYGFLVSWCCQW